MDNPKYNPIKIWMKIEGTPQIIHILIGFSSINHHKPSSFWGFPMISETPNRDPKTIPASSPCNVPAKKSKRGSFAWWATPWRWRIRSSWWRRWRSSRFRETGKITGHHCAGGEGSPSFFLDFPLSWGYHGDIFLLFVDGK